MQFDGMLVTISFEISGRYFQSRMTFVRSTVIEMFKALDRAKLDVLHVINVVGLKIRLTALDGNLVSRSFPACELNGTAAHLSEVDVMNAHV